MAFPRPFGRYLLDERLAMGGMAEIFRGRTSTEGFEKKVCIKRILPHFTEQNDFVTMFRDEAALAARLQHANIVQVFDFGTEEETLFLAMELVDGCDLRKLLDLAKKEGVKVGTGHAMQIAIEVCRGLHHAHTLTDDDGTPLNIVHRDISPHNILVSRAGEVKVTDFGIAKASARATHTGTGVVKGKLAYMAPEQANSRPIDQRLDQFATGIILWEMLTGARLFSGPDEVSVLRKVMMCEVPRPSTLRDDVPGALEDIVMRALAEDPDARFRDMRHFEHALSRCLFEVTNDPEETNLRPIVEAVLGPPEVSRRMTAVLVESPVLRGPGEEVPSLTAAGFSEVFSTSGPSPSAQGGSGSGQKPSGTIALALGDAEAESAAATVIRDGSSSNPVARTPEDGTGITRTIVPDAVSAPSLTWPAPTPPSDGASAASLAPASPVTPPPVPAESTSSSSFALPASAVALDDEQPPRSRLPVVAAAALLGVVGVGLGVVVALGTGETQASDEVLVTRAAPTTTTADEASAPAPNRDDDAEGAAPVAVEAAAADSSAASPEPSVTTQREPARQAAALNAEAKRVEPPARRDEAEAPVPQVTAAPKKAPARAKPRQQARAQRPRAKGKVILEMASGWAHAYLGKRKLCETPCTLELPAGTHLLRLKGGDGSERRHRVTVKADATVRSVVPAP